MFIYDYGLDSFACNIKKLILLRITIKYQQTITIVKNWYINIAVLYLS